jgi:homoserine kinase type II
MSVFTTVTTEQLSAWLRQYALGTLVGLEGIAAGIENTNYFITTSRGRYVLTLFEKLTAAELPFYLGLMAHLARHGIPCPQPLANVDNSYLGSLNGKPAAIVTCVPGRDLANVDTAHCAAIGSLLAEMHLAGQSYDVPMANPRGAAWWAAALPQVLPFLDAPAAALLKAEVAFQAAQPFARLPRGVIHADLFRDNVLWDGARVGGIIDFYFACNDCLLYDVAITVNDWCVATDQSLDAARARALLEAYQQVRRLSDDERAAWPALLRAGALRFWVSRLYDKHLPRAGELTHAKDPGHFQRVLEQRIAAAAALTGLFAS